MIDAQTFIYAGSACFTLTDLSASDRHYTYRVNKKEPSAVAVQQYQTHGGRFKPETVWFVNLGISYEHSIYAGMLKEPGQRAISFTRASRLAECTPSMQLLNRFLCLAADKKFEDGDTADGIKFQHEGKCCVCARPLTNPESIALGIGPECRGKMGI